MSAQPTGTVTFLFTDIEGSTRLWERYPVAMATALVRHDELLRVAVESAGGYVFKTVGDAFCTAFPSAINAVGAAGAAQRALHAEPWPEGAAIRVRMALYTGECEERNGDYFGLAINRTARLAAIGHGGQVLLARETAALVRDRLPVGMNLVDLGSYRLKDLDRQEDVLQLVLDGVPANFPPLRSREAEVPTNLTAPVSSFVARDVEVAEVVKLLTAYRLVTLTGSAGVGKTRLALEAGRAVLQDTPDGVWLVELATVSDPDMVAWAVVGGLGIGEQVGREPVDILVDVLAAQNRLIILDNCEQVVNGCAALADTVCRRCPTISLLATSREPLRIDGEVVYRVPSLSLPPEHVEEPADLIGSGAVALFLERAGSQAPNFQLTNENAHLVGSICRRLDGVPLAVELAAARLRAMSLTQLHDRLDHRFRLLTGGSRVVLPRQQTLRAMVDWSYDLLSEPERALFRRITVFVDGFDLEAAEGVCGLGDMPQWEIEELLASLVDKSLVVVEPQAQTVRYRLLETLRQYGADRLADAVGLEVESSEADRIAAAHSAYFLALAAQVAPRLHGPSSAAWIGRLDSEESNLRVSIEHALVTPEGADSVLSQFWSLQRYWVEARQPAQTAALVERALEILGSDISPTRRAEALIFEGIILDLIDRRLELQAISAALDVAREAGDRSLEARALSRLSRGLAGNGRRQEAVSTGAEAVALARLLDDAVVLGITLFQYAGALDESDPRAAEAAYLEALEVAEASGDSRIARNVHNNYATLLIARGDLGDARRHLEAAIELHGPDTTNPTPMYNNLGWVLLQEGDPQRAAPYFIHTLRVNRLNGGMRGNPYAMLGLACCATRDHAYERAAMLHGGATSLLSANANQWEFLERTIRERDIAVLHERLGGDYERHYSMGLAMAQDEIIRRACSPFDAGIQGSVDSRHEGR